MMLRLGFVGAGTVGTALARSLADRGYAVVAVASRSFASAQRLAGSIPACQASPSGQEVVESANLVFITTPDDAIQGIVKGLVWREGAAVVHCSGAASTSILAAARAQGALTGGFHPLQSFASVEEAIQNLPGSVFALEAEEPLLATLVELAEALEGSWVELKAEDKVLYHAAAVFVSNYTVALMKMAADLWGSFGVSNQKAIQALLPLLKGTVNNIERVGLPRCLTGPIARGDLGTIRRHLEALEESFPDLVAPYQELGHQDVPLALAKGTIDEDRARELEELLRTKQKRSKR
jgi:predicted short-subunit dehydrogenase-like oxidoreductase (DUF2520 family)